MLARSSSGMQSRAPHLEALPSSISMMPQEYVRTEVKTRQFICEDLVPVPNTELPFKKASQREDTQLLYADRPLVRAQHIHNSTGFRTKKPGWIDTRPAAKFQDNGQKSFRSDITVRDMSTILVRYKEFTPEKKASVPIALYLPAKVDLSHQNTAHASILVLPSVHNPVSTAFVANVTTIWGSAQPPLAQNVTHVREAT